MARSRALRVLLTSIVALGLLAGAGAVAFYYEFLRDLPDLTRIEDYSPPVTTLVLDRKGRLIGEFYEERRRLVQVDEIPEHVKHAFVAAEDQHFFEHKGLDYRGILRAALANLRAGGAKKQGASTITQQMVKSLLLSPEKTFRRKFREMILARRIEDHFTKNEILYLYLNQIYFGHGAWGIGQAARGYFGKAVRDLTVGESALLAGLPQRPSAYSPYRDPEAAETRRRYVLGRMLEDGYIEQTVYDDAMLHPPEIGEHLDEANFPPAAHFVELVRRYVFDRLGGDRVLRDGLIIETTLDLDLQRAAVAAVRAGLEAHDKRRGYRGPIKRVAREEIAAEIAGLAEMNASLFNRPEQPTEPEVLEFSEPELELTEGADAIAPAEPAGLAAGLERVAEATEGVIAEIVGTEPVPPAVLLPFDEPLTGVITAVDVKAETAMVAFAPDVEGEIRLEDVTWARPVDPKSRPWKVTRIQKVFHVGDVARFVRLEDWPAEDEDGPDAASPEGGDDAAALAAVVPRMTLFQTPIVEGALLSLDNEHGDVTALVGGYDYNRSEFNRATQALRQPGSAFKPFIYGAALERGYTPVSEVVDRPVVYTDPVSGFVWAPRNYGRQFFGPMPMRNALKKSINNATVHLFRDVGVDFVIDYARRFGIQSELSRDLSLALGSSSVTLLELTTAYAVFPNKGHRVVPRFITRVSESDGHVLLEDVPLGKTPPPVLKPLAASELAADDGAPIPRPRDTQISPYPDAEILPNDEVISEAAAYLMADLLKAVVQEGTGRKLRSLNRPLAGKTGTTNNQGDAWFMGFSPEVTTGVWVGHDDNSVLGWGETGAGAALPIWKDFMTVALANRPIRDFDVPKEHIVFERIDRETGLVADATSDDAYFQPFIEGTVPKRSVSQRESVSEARRALRDDVF